MELLLTEIPVRPLVARRAVMNIASLRVLQKCGFKVVGHQCSLGDQRYVECEDTILEFAGPVTI